MTVNNSVKCKKSPSRPMLKDSQIYALQSVESKRFAVRTHCVSEAERADTINTESPKEARRFAGGFLNRTAWDWQVFYKPVNPACTTSRY